MDDMIYINSKCKNYKIKTICEMTNKFKRNSIQEEV